MEIALFLIAGLFLGGVPFYKRHVLKVDAPTARPVPEPDVGPGPVRKGRVIIEDIPTADPDLSGRSGGVMGRPGPQLVDETELMWLARTLWGEARGESDEGVAAVAHAILNRVKDPRWPSTIKAVVLQPWQFSMWNADDPNRDRALALTDDNAQYRRVRQIGRRVMTGSWPDPHGVPHYANETTVGGRPWWAKGRGVTVAARIGGHTFYEGVA